MKKFLILCSLFFSEYIFAGPSLYKIFICYLSFGSAHSLILPRPFLNKELERSKNIPLNYKISLKSFDMEKKLKRNKFLSKYEKNMLDKLARASISTYDDTFDNKDFELYKESKKKSKLKWVSFRNKKTQEVILAFRGTKSLFDLHIDCLLYLFGRFYLPVVFNHPGLLGSVVQGIDEAVQETFDEEDVKAWVTGHSLGGVYAQIASWLYGIDGSSFSSPSIMNGWVKALNLKDLETNKISFKNILVQGDLVPITFRSHGKYHGQICLIDLPQTGYLDSHSMVETIAFLKSDESKSLVQEDEVCISCRVLGKKFVLSLRNLF